VVENGPEFCNALPTVLSEAVVVKINGKTYLERDYIGEYRAKGYKTKLIRAACNRFLSSRGIESFEDGWRPMPISARKAKPRL
jgi:hypothetical protein